MQGTAREATTPPTPEGTAGVAGTGGCMNISGKVHMATRYTNNLQYVYLTYTITCGNKLPSKKAYTTDCLCNTSDQHGTVLIVVAGKQVCM